MEHKKCLRPGCKNIGTARGLCNEDYSRASQLVKQGVTTWEQLEEHKKCWPRKAQRTEVARQWFLKGITHP